MSSIIRSLKFAEFLYILSSKYTFTAISIVLKGNDPKLEANEGIHHSRLIKSLCTVASSDPPRSNIEM